jgi:hypothetical protein
MKVAKADFDAIMARGIGAIREADKILGKHVEPIRAPGTQPVGPAAQAIPIKASIEPRAAESPVEAKTISERLDEARWKADISHEEQAARIKISRTAYFEVKAGRGGRKSRRKVELYLKNLLSGR